MKQIVKNIFISVIVLFICFVGGCNRPISNNTTLVSAEKLMNENPDSAFVLLQGLDTLTLKNAADKALYSLLYVQAEDKTYIDSKDVYRIQTAVDYYKDSDDEYHKMLSYYYLARIEENRQEYSKAIINLLKAEDVAESISNYFYLGLIYRSISDIYSHTYNNIESLKYAQLSYDSFIMSGDTSYANWALWDIARAYHNGQDYESSAKVSKDIISNGYTNNDVYLVIDGLRLAGMSYLGKNDYEQAIRAYEEIIEIDSTVMSVEDYRNLGLAYLGKEQIEKASGCMQLIHQTDTSQQWLSYEMYKYWGNYKQALSALEIEHAYQDQVLRDIITENVTASVAEYMRYEHQLKEQEVMYERKSRIISISLLVLIMALICIIAILKNISQRKEIEKNMILASSLRQMLLVKETEVSKMSTTIQEQQQVYDDLNDAYNENIGKISNENAELQNAINNLFEHSFLTIDQLTSAYYEYQGSANEKQKIYTDVMSIVSGIGSDKKTIEKIERFVNTYKSNIMQRFRTEFPGMKQSDYILYLYVVAGFSSRAIGVFLGEKLDVVYNRKSRLKQKISKSNSVNKEYFIAALR